MSVLSKSQSEASKWLDSLAVGMALLCAVHCLITPVLIVLLPLLTTTFWVHHDFHLWMLLFVIPTTCVAMFMGCRKHRDKWVIGLGVSGLMVLVGVVVYSSLGDVSAAGAHCEACENSVGLAFTDPVAWTNVAGGFLLISGHVRNFRLCRKQTCSH
ncbi:MAG: MerC domain-containing protein [Verrucomicrobiota bacterium]